MESLLKNVDRRLQRVEQILPTLATKDDLQGFATKDDLQRFATKDDLVQSAEHTRRYFDIVAERLRDDIRLIAEGQAHLARRVEEFRTELTTDIAGLDRRVMRLEAAVTLRSAKGRKPTP
ncbi:MAG: hypothetical protein A3H29_12185 [Acidobacteria bacterium RIFCSPLOWO2_02_FULL_67_21]|nr:MAG: hypothetical protein A3H29_12185 [Acidobacteria bacterium RIFCSPLOWO2_02_FULL_67_21]